MLKPLPAFLATLGICAAAFAQEASPNSGAAKSKSAVAKPTDKPGFVPTPTPAESAAPAPESPGVLQRIFGTRQKKRTLFPVTPAPQTDPATPAPATSKTTAKKAKLAPAPVVKKRTPKPKATEGEPDTSVAKAEPTTPTTDTTEPSVPTKKSRKGKATPAVAKTGGTPEPEGDPETAEKLRFDQAKAKAAEDPQVMELKAKADGAASDEEARSAQRAYNKALFSKMRKIDGSIDARIDQMEAAVLKRLDEK